MGGILRVILVIMKEEKACLGDILEQIQIDE